VIRVAEERPLAGEAAHAAGDFRPEGQVAVPDIPVLGRGDVVEAEPLAAAGEQADLRSVDGGAEQPLLEGVTLGAQVGKGGTYDLFPQVFRRDVHDRFLAVCRACCSASSTVATPTCRSRLLKGSLSLFFPRRCRLCRGLAPVPRSIPHL
jgi:hypothetical protein